jgi:hypothetical protein
MTCFEKNLINTGNIFHVQLSLYQFAHSICTSRIHCALSKLYEGLIISLDSLYEVYIIKEPKISYFDLKIILLSISYSIPKIRKLIFTVYI